MRLRALVSMLALGAGLAIAPPPALSQQGRVLPADPQDFQCFVLMQQRRAVLSRNNSIPPQQRADILNNLTIISAFYAGRLSHYSSAEAVSQFRSAAAIISGSTDEQLDTFANDCASFYLSVMDVLGNTSQQANSPQQQPPQTGVPQEQR
ncbi:hypothetical protein [Aurantiacibacter poecillastricola]|uniref:hypothetical protein n=1 Tax=Aurantiacibacter poecillastricola TaxID=3064385 RepID=UPI0027402851|nr:hypothetical protein [Aurantiacibacter sp. 219JJ12-13]MDP5262059.1 hypothetical protein [Aurantiacibacter sp. 219JJ12-13]